MSQQIPQTNKATITANTGPGKSTGGAVLNDILSIKLDFERNVATIDYGSPRQVVDMSLSGVTTITCTISGNNKTLVIS